jgi:hypothetical protein
VSMMPTAKAGDQAIADRHATAHTPSHRYLGQAMAHNTAIPLEYSPAPWHGLPCSSMGHYYTRTDQTLAEAKARSPTLSRTSEPGPPPQARHPSPR